MRRFERAILAGVTLVAAMLLHANSSICANVALLTEDHLGTFPEIPGPTPVTFRLADGHRIRGKMTDWDESGIDGTFGRRRWDDIKTDDIWGLHQRFMDSDDAEAWYRLGGVLLMVLTESQDGRKDAERALRKALRLEPLLGPEIEDLYLRRAKLEQDRARAKQQAESEKLSSTTPEAKDWPASPWPRLSADEREMAIRTIKGDALSILESTGSGLRVCSTPYAVVYSGLDEELTIRWADHFDRAISRTNALMRQPMGDNPFWGKCIVFLFANADRYRLVQAESFGHYANAQERAITHFQGPKVYVSALIDPDDRGFAETLAHEAVHAYLHRHRSPVRLPAWANEGVAEWVATSLEADSTRAAQARADAVAFVREGGNVGAALNMDYLDGTWPGPAGLSAGPLGPSVGYLMVTTMINDKPNEFRKWINGVKAGEDWVEALKTRFGVPAEALVETFVRYYRVND